MSAARNAPPPRRRGRTARDDRGASFAQYAALILCVAAIAGSVAVVAPARTGDLFSSALCRIKEAAGMGGECEDGDDQAQDEDDWIEPEPGFDYTPAYCVKQGSKQTYGGSVTIAFLEFGQEYSYAREDLSNGKIVITFLPTSSAKATAGAGFDFGAGESAHAGASVSASAGVKLGSGMTYIFEDENEFEEFEEEVNEAIAMETSRTMNPTADGMLRFGDWIGVYDYPEIERDPDVRTTTVGIEAEVAGSAGAWAGPGEKRRKDGDGGAWTMNLGAEGSFTASRTRDHATWYTDPDNIQKSDTYSWTAEGSLGATALSAHADGSISWNGGTRIMRNEDGSIANIRYIAGAEGKFSFGVDKNVGNKTGKGNDVENGGNGSVGTGEANSVTQMVQVDFENTPEEQAAAEQLLDEYGLAPPPYATNAMANQLDEEDNGGRVLEEPGPDADPWDEIFYRRGTAWQYASDKKIDQGEFGAQVKLGMQFGASVNWELEEKDTKQALMLEPPNEGGRRFIDYADCLSDDYSEEEGQ
ncbi:hypothetical protein [Nocardiopsis halophila]|uniref:hypothetical protein n=1 Tax=Nocardiopsis halophila TaxID=141692 RepID=UPI001F4CBD66|nr:hypothetical protein [Nocardiopsis halophila]